MAENASAQRAARTQGSEGRTATAPAQKANAPVSRTGARPALSAKPRRNSASPVATLAFAAVVLTILAYAWSLRLERHITAKEGLGYAFGITGGILLLGLMLYPLRKYWKRMRGRGAVPGWFRLHMVIGIVAPALIVLHSNFRLSAINSSIAMFSMLTVVASGLVGRFLYSKIHAGLYGQKAELAALRQEAETFRLLFGAGMEASALLTRLKAAEDALFPKAATPFSSLAVLLGLIKGRRRQYAELMQEAQANLAAVALREHWEREALDWHIDAASDHLASYQSSLIAVAQYRCYERLFSLWHHLHMPLYILLVITALVHVVTVHLY